MSSKNKTFSNKSKPKKLGLMSCIVVVIGACIGAGIFFKNGSILTNTQHNLYLAISCWVIAGLGVLAIGLALTEVVSGCREQSNIGIAYWVKTFNSRYLYKSCKNFLVFIYTPIILIALAYYFVQALFSAINPIIGSSWIPTWWQCMIVALVILSWFFFTSGLSVRLFNVQSWIIMCFKFIPLIFAIVIGYIILWSNSGHLPTPSSPELNSNTKFLTDYSPVLGIVASIPAIFFAFNGFQYPASMTSSMKEPRQLPISMLIGIIIVIIVYVLISLSLILGAFNGSVDGLKDWLDSKKIGWMYNIVYILIGVGILSVINGTVTTGVNNYEEFIQKNEIIGSQYFQKMSQKVANRPMAGVLYCYMMTLIIFALCTIIGCFYIPISVIHGAHFDKQSLGIFNFVDVVSNWDALFIYIFIGIPIIGCLINRKTHRVKIVKSKIFMPAAIISFSLIGISFLYILVQIFTDLGLVIHYYNHKETEINDVISKVMSIITFFMYLGIIFIPSYVGEKRLKHKFLRR